MPTIVATSWNVANAGWLKATNALARLAGWGGALAPPPGAAWPGALVPAGGAPAWRRDVLCEVLGNTLGFFVGISPSLAPGMVPATVGIPLVGGNPTWVGVKHRVHVARRNAQKGYFGNGAPPQRVHTVRPAPWPGGVTPMWGMYPIGLGAFGGAFPHVWKPANNQVRIYMARRELIVDQGPGLIVAWYHAISGGGASTVYDLFDVINWLRQRAAGAGGRQVVVLLGDLNLVPNAMRFYLAPPGFAPPTVPGLPGGLLPGPVGPAAAVTLPPNSSGVLATGLPTHSGGNELDYAVVMHIDPAPPLPPVNVNAFIQCGTSGALGALGPAPGAGGAFAPLNIPGGAFITDHRPIRVQVDF